MMKKTPPLNTLALFVFTLGLTALSAPAATIGYWRFESSPGFLNDSSGNGLTLTQASTSPDPVTNPALAGSGETSDFFNPIPQTGQSNGKVAQFDGASETTSSYLVHADSPEFEVSSFTLELMFNQNAGTNYLVSQNDASGDQRSWALRGGANLLLVLSSNGQSGSGNSVLVNSTFAISDDVDYYAAFSFNESNGDVTFYLQDLTNGGTLQSETVASGLTGGVHDSTGDFVIGSLPNSPKNDWIGSIDEVRLSNTLLPQSQLLATVPEPGTVALLALGGMGLLAFRRSR